MAERRNRNRGYRQLRVWREAVELYVESSRVFRGMPYELRRVASQNVAAADSVHRNIAEGYCRRSIREYIQHLYISLGSLGELVSGIHACHEAGQVSGDVFEHLDAKTFRLENGLIRLVESLERKRNDGDWTDSMIVQESNAAYGAESSQVL